MSFENGEWNNTCLLFKNVKKTKPNHPDCRGEARIDGVWYHARGWVKHSDSYDNYKRPRKYLRLTFTRKEAQQSDRASKSHAEVA